MEKILSINSGSSSLKFKLFAMPDEKVLAKGLFDRIGIDNSRVTIKYDGKKYDEQRELKDHNQAVHVLLSLFKELKLINDFNEITGVGHRVVAGGEYFDKSVIVDEDVMNKIDELAEYAPLHNPAELVGIRVFKELLPNAVSVAVFDTAYHQTMPKTNYMYSIPYEWYEKYHVRKYGAHGTSHRYVAHEAAKLLDKPFENLKIITCHLGAGASICATMNGKSFDTSMGFTPLAGITMATRAGDIDASLVSFMMEKLQINSSEMIDILNHKAGLIGISGVSSDMRDVLAAADDNERAQLAVDIFVKNVVKYIGSYIAEMGGVDTIVFTAGIGENSTPIRKLVMERLAYLGITIDEEENSKHGSAGVISGEDSTIKVLRIPTNEELMIARDVQKLEKEVK